MRPLSAQRPSRGAPPLAPGAAPVRGAASPRVRALPRVPMPAVLALLVSVLAACATPRVPVRGIEVAHAAEFDLEPPAALGCSLSLDQSIEAEGGGHASSYRCLLEVGPERLVLVGLTALGTRAFTIRFAGDEVEVLDHTGGRLPADPARILADLQLALWPELTALRGLEVVERALPGGGHERLLARGGTPVIRVRYTHEVRWEGELRFEHLERDYGFVARTLSAEVLE